MHLFITLLLLTHTEEEEEEKLPFRAFERSLTLITASYSSLEEKPINSKSYFRSYHDVDDDEEEREDVRPGLKSSRQDRTQDTAAAAFRLHSASLSLSCS